MVQELVEKVNMDQYNNIYIQDYLGLFEKSILPVITIIMWPFFVTTSLVFKTSNFINDIYRSSKD